MNILILTNILTPYRIFFYDKLNDYMKKINGDLKVVVMAKTEPNRSWSYDSFKRDYTVLLNDKSYNLKGNIFIHSIKNIGQILKSFNPDVIILGGSYLTLGINKLFQYKEEFNYRLLFWSESHLNESKGYGNLKIFVRNFIRKNIIGKFNEFCVPGKLAKQYIETYAPKHSSYYYLPNLVDNNTYEKAYIQRNTKREFLLEKYKVENNKFIFLLPARLTAVKGILEFLNLYNNVNNREKAIILIAGTGELKDEIEKFIADNKLNVVILGERTQEEMLELYTLSNCLLLPSLSDPNPLSCIEALWAGLSLIVSNKVGNYPEVIKEGKNGFVFDYNDFNGSVHKIENIINSDLKWLENATLVSRNIAKNDFLPEKVIEGLITQIRKLK